MGSGRGFQYIEPQAAVSLNNELAAARGEMFAAEEEVLWKLTGQLADYMEDIERALQVVGAQNDRVMK